MKTTLKIDDDVYESVVALSKAMGKTPGVVVSDLLRKAIKHGSVDRENDFPSFKISSDADIIPGDRANKILSEEI